MPRTADPDAPHPHPRRPAREDASSGMRLDEPRVVSPSATAARELRAMGTDVHLIVVGSAAARPELLDRATVRIAQLEQRWSRFRRDSEISRLNAAAGRAVAVSEDTVLLVRTAIAAHRESGGAFDPLLLPALVAAGYDRSFDELPHSRDDVPAVPTAPGSFLAGCEDIEIDGTTVRLPAGTGFDPGGIGKGLAADLVSAELREAGAAGACVNMGGDVRVRGAGPGQADDDDRGWTIAVEHPQQRDPIVLIGVRDGAVATSTTLRRRWVVGGELRHHLIDPATGMPSTSDLDLATAVAAEAWQAEVMAKAVLLRGTPHPFDLIDGAGAEALAVTRDGQVVVSDGFAAFTGTALIPRHLASPASGRTPAPLTARFAAPLPPPAPVPVPTPALAGRNAR